MKSKFDNKSKDVALQTNDDLVKSRKGIFRTLELIAESAGWIQIVASPLLIGLVIGAIIYFSDRTALRLVIGITVAAAGLIIGIIWATKQWRGKGTIWFMSRIAATPDLDHTEDEAIERKTKLHDGQEGN